MPYYKNKTLFPLLLLNVFCFEINACFPCGGRAPTPPEERAEASRHPRWIVDRNITDLADGLESTHTLNEPPREGYKLQMANISDQIAEYCTMDSKHTLDISEFPENAAGHSIVTKVQVVKLSASGLNTVNVDLNLGAEEHTLIAICGNINLKTRILDVHAWMDASSGAIVTRKLPPITYNNPLGRTSNKYRKRARQRRACKAR